MDGRNLSTQSEDEQPAENQPKQTGEQQSAEQPITLEQVNVKVESLKTAASENSRILTNCLDEHTENTKIHLTRRQTILYSALGLAGVLAGKRILTWIGNSLQSFKPQFNVHIYSDKEIKSSDLSEAKRALITASNRHESIDGRLNGYIEIGFKTKRGLATARIYKYSDLLVAGVDEKGTKPFIPREADYTMFTFVAQGPGLAEKVVRVCPDFLNNEKLLARVIEGQKLDWKRGHEVFYYYNLNDFICRTYHGFKIPDRCSLQLKGDNVDYEIKGLEALTDGDENLFAEFWIRRNEFKDYKTFKKQYDTFALIRKELGDSVSAEQAAKKLPNLAEAYKQQGDSSDFTQFMDQYALFSEAAKRVEASRLQEK